MSSALSFMEISIAPPIVNTRLIWDNWPSIAQIALFIYPSIFALDLFYAKVTVCQSCQAFYPLRLVISAQYLNRLCIKLCPHVSDWS